MSSISQIDEKSLEHLTEKYEKTGKLTIEEWSKFDRLQKKLQPEKFKARREKEKLESNVERAKQLPTKELIKIIHERNEGYTVMRTLDTVKDK